MLLYPYANLILRTSQLQLQCGMDIPYLDIDDTMASMRKALAEDARVRIADRDWEKPSIVRDFSIWRQRITQTNDPVYMQWCWLSTVQSAPSWERMNVLHTKEWMPVWLHFLQMDDASWSLVKPLENGRLETQWIRHLRDVLHAHNVQPLLDWWSLRSDANVDDDQNFFWKAAFATLAESPELAETLNNYWILELSKHRTDPGLLFEWSYSAASTMAVVPEEYREWLRDLIKRDTPVIRTLPFRQAYTNTLWQDTMVQDILHGACQQEHTSPWPPLPTNIQQMWPLVSHCSYRTRLDIAQNFLATGDVFSSSERWPLDYHKMERTIYRAEPNADLAHWGTSPWLAGLLHILPEFAHVLVFHDILPVTPVQAHDLVILYKDNCEWEKHPELYKISSELFENDTQPM